MACAVIVAHRVATLQTLARRDDIAELTAGYGLIIADECHHVPAATSRPPGPELPGSHQLD
jgi:superfamily II DNA or RNA helicase